MVRYFCRGASSLKTNSSRGLVTLRTHAAETVHLRDLSVDYRFKQVRRIADREQSSDGETKSSLRTLGIANIVVPNESQDMCPHLEARKGRNHEFSQSRIGQAIGIAVFKHESPRAKFAMN